MSKRSYCSVFFFAIVRNLSTVNQRLIGHLDIIAINLNIHFPVQDPRRLLMGRFFSYEFVILWVVCERKHSSEFWHIQNCIQDWFVKKKKKKKEPTFGDEKRAAHLVVFLKIFILQTAHMYYQDLLNFMTIWYITIAKKKKWTLMFHIHPMRKT